METCLSDPARSSLACTMKSGDKYVLPFEKAKDYVCFPLPDFKVYVESCHK